MKTYSQTEVCADVVASETTDELIVRPRDLGDQYVLRRELSAAMPGVPLRRSAGGIVVSALQSWAMLEILSPDLRWTDEARRIAQNRLRVVQVRPKVLNEIRCIVAGSRAMKARSVDGLENLDVLDDHQVVNVAAMTVPDGFGLCVFDEQGAGKTVTLIFAFDVLMARDEIDFCLIVAPKSMILEWSLDFERFRGGLYQVVVASGSRSEKRLALRKTADVVVTNFETAVSMEADLRSLLRQHGDRAIMVIDESFYVKNLNARRTRSLRRLREWCGRAFVLCGTPAPNSPHDLVQQFALVDFGCTFAGITIPENRQAAGPVIRAAIDGSHQYVRNLKRDVLPELAAKRFHRTLLHLAPQQLRLYEGALKDLIVDVKSASPETFARRLGSFLARRTALLQICSHPRGVTDSYDEIPTKLRALDEILAHQIHAEGEKVVLWSFYTASIDAIMTRYAKFGAVRYDGTVSNVADRRDAVRRFQEDEETMLLVANPAAAGAGLTLHRARLAVYESMSNQAAHYLQSVDRIHRRGQKRETEFVVLLCHATIEEDEFRRLTEKERASQKLLGDPTDRAVTRDTMLAELTQLDDRLRR